MPAKNELISELKNTLKHCLVVLETAVNDPLQFDQLKELVPKLNFTGRDSDNLPGPSREEYMAPLLNAYYFTRYGLTYAFEYSLIYEAIIRDIAQSDDPSEINVAAFGCGSMIDAWSLAYSKMKLIETTHIPEMREIGLSYHGFDGARWNIYFAGADAAKYDANGNPTGSPARVNECFLKDDGSGNMVQNMPWINGFSAAGEGVDIAEVFADPQYRDVIGDCNVFFFPKILNELKEDKLKAIIAGIQEMARNGCFKRNEIYIVISHSYNDIYSARNLPFGEDPKRLKNPSFGDNRFFARRVAEAINYNNEYSVSGDILEGSPLFSKKFGSRGFELSPAVNLSGELYKTYEFHKFDGDYGKHSSYIDALDFSFGGPIKQSIKTFDERAEGLGIPRYKKMITTANYIAMQVIKLTKGNRS